MTAPPLPLPPHFHVAWQTRQGMAPGHDLVLEMYAAPTSKAAPRWIALAHPSPLSPDAFRVPDPLPASAREPLRKMLHVLDLEAGLAVWLDPDSLSLTCSAAPGILHYLRLADGSLKPLPPEPGRLAFERGDAYIALTPGARAIARPAEAVGLAAARFLHLRDYFNAEKLAEALLAHLAELGGGSPFPEDVTVLVIEAR